MAKKKPGPSTNRKVEAAPPPKLNEMQKTALKALRRGDVVVALICGWGSGKTATLVFTLHMVGVALRPGRRILLVTDTHKRYARVLQPEMRKWLEGWGWQEHIRDGKWLHAETGSEIVVCPYFRPGTKASTSNSLEGIDVTSGVAVVDEGQTMSSEVYTKIWGRIRSGPSPQVVVAGLPVWGAWWVEAAVKAGCVPIRSASHVNKAVIGAWLASIEGNIPEREYRKMVLAIDEPPEGIVYSMWLPNGQLDQTPGNLVEPRHWWRYKPEMIGRVLVDPGVEKPVAILVVHDDDPRWGVDGGVDVIVGEICPGRLGSVEEFCAKILEVAWPRTWAEGCAWSVGPDGCPEPKGPQEPRIWLDEGVIDRAGRRAAAANGNKDVTMTSWVDDLARPPTDGGIGLTLSFTDQGERTLIENGVRCVSMWMVRQGQRRLLMLSRVWEDGGAAEQSLRKSILGYKRGPSGQPVKENGLDDPVDTLRYAAVRWQWVSVKPPSGGCTGVLGSASAAAALHRGETAVGIRSSNPRTLR
jgi:hypothetical protein